MRNTLSTNMGINCPMGSRRQTLITQQVSKCTVWVSVLRKYRPLLCWITRQVCSSHTPNHGQSLVSDIHTTVRSHNHHWYRYHFCFRVIMWWTLKRQMYYRVLKMFGSHHRHQNVVAKRKRRQEFDFEDRRGKGKSYRESFKKNTKKTDITWD